ncbi:DNA (cytosine-5-)-methyltransferase [Corynebacterium xerosis]|uniref:DNA (cytosine-5-)-methyltransferase n=1 Tax=Corynebacterium xerosis TaxID=1725 RepID=A0A2N6T0J4_9CORY|nr:DNA cytosine methyltransferase [Corynebacterium xerosis]PMC62830.1 DNA (cytosine-5-)-methyltransferase [Corynebacterium xerosis]
MNLHGVELFAGGGGLLLGSSLAGVEHVAAVEWNRWACQTMRENATAHHRLVEGLKVLEGDVRDVRWTEVVSDVDIDLVTGGPPCQPFSLGGLARSADDPRDMFPAMTEVIAELRPKAFIVENVKGLTREAFKEYFDYVKLRLQFPTLRATDGEDWRHHWHRLQGEHSEIAADVRYELTTTVVNAADYGVPQHRHRVFIVGFRSDIEVDWKFPASTHSGAALALAQAEGGYWDKWKVSEGDRVHVRRKPLDDGKLPWKTVREALADIPRPLEGGTPGWLDHVYQPGARSYPGHTGSPLDEPSKALKAGGHGVPGGENMIRYPNGDVRYYSTREAARIQTFPDDYALHGAWSEAMRQIGNAVPVELARIVVASVVESLTASMVSVK